MKNILKSLAIISTVAFAVILFSNFAMAETGNGTTTATISHNTMTITQLQALSFGTFTVNATTAGTINESADVTGGVTAVEAGFIGQMQVSAGDKNAAVTVSISTTSTLSNGADSMIANLFINSARTVTSDNTITLGADGTKVVYAYGVLTVPAGQPAKTYNGTYTLTVTYN